MKQTAVQWLIDEYFGGIENCTPDFRYHIDKAIEMEKEQIISFAEWYSGMEKEKVERAYKRYLNETFKSE